MNRMTKGILCIVLLVLLIFSFGSASLAQETEENMPYLSEDVYDHIFTVINVEEIYGDMVSFSGSIVINAHEIVYGNVVSFNGPIMVQGQVHGDVVSFNGNVTLQENAMVMGDVVVLNGEISRQDTAVIMGNIVTGGGMGGFRDFGRNFSTGGSNVNFNFGDHRNHHHRGTTFFSSVLQLLGLLGLAALGASLFPRHLNTMSLELTRDIFRILLVGLAAWIVYPFIMLVLIITIIGIPIALIMGLLIPLIFLLGTLVTAAALGSAGLRPMLSNTFSWAREPNLLIEGLLGVLVLWLVSQAPIVGWFVIPLAAIFGLGVIVTTKFGTNKPWFAKKEKPIDEENQIGEEEVDEKK